MDLRNIDLTFLIDRQQAIQVRNAVMDEMDSWGNLLDPPEMDKYLLMIKQLNKVIDGLKGGDAQW